MCCQPDEFGGSPTSFFLRRDQRFTNGVARLGTVVLATWGEPPEVSELFAPGDEVDYYSEKRDRWYAATVVQADSGYVELDLKPGEWIDAAYVQRR